MTKTEKLTILAELDDRAFDNLSKVSPDSDEFVKNVAAVHNIRQVAELVAYTDGVEAMIVAAESIATPSSVGFELVPEEEVTEEIRQQHEPEANCEKPDATPAIDRKELVARLTHLNSTYGVNVGELIQEMGYTNIGAMPESRYVELLRRATVLAGPEAKKEG